MQYMEMDIIFMDSENRKTNNSYKLLSNFINKGLLRFSRGRGGARGTKTFLGNGWGTFFFQTHSLGYEIKRKTIIFIFFLRRVEL